MRPFALERYFAKHEFTAKHLLCGSDCEPFPQADLLKLADDETRGLWESLKLGYTESRGHPLLREEIAALYPGVSPDRILTVVPEEGIFLAMRAALSEGDRLVCTFPAYQSLYEVAKSLRCETAFWRPVEERGWTFDLDDLKTLLRPRTKLLVINFPHNPTGWLPTPETFRRILDLAEENGATVFSDEMYRFLEHDPREHLSSAADSRSPNVVLGGLSKAFGLAGLRSGWLVLPDSGLYGKASELKDYTTICASAPSEILSIIALRARKALLDANMLRIRRNTGLLDGFFAKYAEVFGGARPRGGTVCFPRLREGDSGDFCRRILEETGILLAPSHLFDYGRRHVRFGFGREDMPGVLAKLDEHLSGGRV